MVYFGRGGRGVGGHDFGLAVTVRRVVKEMGFAFCFDKTKVCCCPNSFWK